MKKFYEDFGCSKFEVRWISYRDEEIKEEKNTYSYNFYRRLVDVNTFAPSGKERVFLVTASLELCNEKGKNLIASLIKSVIWDGLKREMTDEEREFILLKL